MPDQPTIQDIPLLNYYEVKKAAMILRALNHEYRQQMLKIIEKEESITVTDLYVKLHEEQSVVSQHLRILREAGIVKAVRKGKYIYYEVNRKRIDAIQSCINALLG